MIAHLTPAPAPATAARGQVCRVRQAVKLRGQTAGQYGMSRATCGGVGEGAASRCAQVGPILLVHLSKSAHLNMPCC
jgi:hypothetical protein